MLVPLDALRPPALAAWASILLLGRVGLQAAHLATHAVDALCMWACYGRLLSIYYRTEVKYSLIKTMYEGFPAHKAVSVHSCWPYTA